MGKSVKSRCTRDYRSYRTWISQCHQCGSQCLHSTLVAKYFQLACVVHFEYLKWQRNGRYAERGAHHPRDECRSKADGIAVVRTMQKPWTNFASDCVATTSRHRDIFRYIAFLKRQSKGSRASREMCQHRRDLEGNQCAFTAARTTRKTQRRTAKLKNKINKEANANIRFS